MKKFRLALILALFVFAGTTSASAHEFGLSINLGAPSYYVGPPVVYAPPPVYYSPPPTTYYEPAPAYYGYGYDDARRFGHEHGYYRGGYGHYEDDSDDDDDDD